MSEVTCVITDTTVYTVVSVFQEVYDQCGSGIRVLSGINTPKQRIHMMETDNSMIAKEREAYSAFRAGLNEAADGAETLDALLQLEDILYDIIEEEFQINYMLDQFLKKQGEGS